MSVAGMRSARPLAKHRQYCSKNRLGTTSVPAGSCWRMHVSTIPPMSPMRSDPVRDCAWLSWISKSVAAQPSSHANQHWSCFTGLPCKITACPSSEFSDIERLIFRRVWLVGLGSEVCGVLARVFRLTSVVLRECRRHPRSRHRRGPDCRRRRLRQRAPEMPALDLALGHRVSMACRVAHPPELVEIGKLCLQIGPPVARLTQVTRE